MAYICCSHRRPSIVKRWVENGVFYAIERCRRCDNGWDRLEIRLVEENGQLKTVMKRIKMQITVDNSEITSTQNPSL